MVTKRWSADHERLRGLLRSIRLEADLTQLELAEKLGHTQGYVSKYESGEIKLDLLEVREICTVCGLNLVDFAKRIQKEFK